MRPHPLQVSHVRFTPASPDDEARGLLGFLRFQVGVLLVDGATVRRSRAGHVSISWPAPRGFEIVRPLDERARRSIESQVLAALGITEVAP